MQQRMKSLANCAFFGNARRHHSRAVAILEQHFGVTFREIRIGLEQRASLIAGDHAHANRLRHTRRATLRMCFDRFCRRRDIQTENEDLFFINGVALGGLNLQDIGAAGLEGELARTLHGLPGRIVNAALQGEPTAHRGGQIVLEIKHPMPRIRPSTLPSGRAMDYKGCG